MERPAEAAGLPWIEAALEERHAVPAPGQKDRQERAGETGADEGDLGGVAGGGFIAFASSRSGEPGSGLPVTGSLAIARDDGEKGVRDDGFENGLGAS